MFKKIFCSTFLVIAFVFANVNFAEAVDVWVHSDRPYSDGFTHTDYFVVSETVKDKGDHLFTVTVKIVGQPGFSLRQTQEWKFWRTGGDPAAPDGCWMYNHSYAMDDPDQLPKKFFMLA